MIAAFLLSISPYSIYYAQEAKMYSLLWFLMILSFFYLLKIIKRNNTSSFWMYILSTTLCVYTMYIGFLFMLIQNIIFFCIYRGKVVKKWGLAQAGVALPVLRQPEPRRLRAALDQQKVVEIQ